ncbi:hypothetical protein [Alteromonas gracilis]|uniref:hypothetical protein n=1 Tax=Alteromonas gracilis TaxID=1479524 RepID=UPI0030D41485
MVILKLFPVKQDCPMPLCNTTFNMIAAEDVDSVLSAFSKECFVDGQAAYKLEGGTYSIDAGENDIRARYDQDSETVEFICRYKVDLPFYEKKLLAFASKHGISTSIQSTNAS